MGLAHHPKIVTDGLVLSLDAFDRKSYPGSGSTWYDRSGNGNNGTLNNGAVFSSLGGGSISTDGIDDYIDLGNDSSLDITGAFSLEIFFYGGSGIDFYGGLLNKADSGNFGNWGLYSDIDNNYVRFGFKSTSGAQYEVNNSNYSDLSTEAWVHYLGVYTGEELYLYRNGMQIGSTSIPSQHGTPQTNSYNAAIGRRSVTNNYEVDFNVSIARVYNKSLTADEVLQNYQATRSRFS